MANKFIVFVLFAFAAQVSLAAADRRSLKRTSRYEWHQVGETICKAVRNNSQSITDAEAAYEKHQRAGETALAKAAHLSHYPPIEALREAEYKANRDALFNSLEVARGCKNYTATRNAIGKYQNSLQHARFLIVLHRVTEDRRSPTRAVNARKYVYALLFNEIQKLAKSVCGGGGAIDSCPTNQLNSAFDKFANIVYSWLRY